MTELTKITERLNECLSIMEIDAKKLHNLTGIGLRTCYRIIKGESSLKVEMLSEIKKAIPQISITYILTGYYECKKSA